MSNIISLKSWKEVTEYIDTYLSAKGLRDINVNSEVYNYVFQQSKGLPAKINVIFENLLIRIEITILGVPGAFQEDVDF